ncbi:MAG TPA: cation transporter, partial [Labilithrix sp.]
AIAFVLELGSFIVGMRKLLAVRRGRPLMTTWRESKDPRVFTVLAEDAASLVGVAVAFSGIFLSRLTGIPFFDPLASLVIGAILIVVSLMLVWENRGLLIGESAQEPLVEGVRAIIERDRSVRTVGPLLTMHLGPGEVLLDVDLEFASALSLDDLREAIVRLEKAIQSAYPIVTRIYIEAASFARSRAEKSSHSSHRTAEA